MSATAQTGNYHLPIYEPGNLANYMVDWNGAMNTIDSALNVNHQDADKLKTDFENLETEFQQVKTESSGAATAATQAQEDAARAITIANNATTVAGDAQVDAHAALTQISKLTKDFTTITVTSNDSGSIFSRQYLILSDVFIHYAGGITYRQPYNEDPNWKYLISGGIKGFYNSSKNLYNSLSKHNLIPTTIPDYVLMYDIAWCTSDTNNLMSGTGIQHGVYVKNNSEAYLFYAFDKTQDTPGIWVIPTTSIIFKSPILDPIQLVNKNNTMPELELFRPYLLN